MILCKPLVLIGLMGVGKTTLGVRLARLLQCPFVDTDQMIEKHVGCSIADLFYYAGEHYFRQWERRVVQELIESPPQVIATGGGLFLDPHNRALILDHAIPVWIQASLPVLVERVSRRKATRPLLENGDIESILAEMMQHREPLYAEAPIHVSSDGLNHYAIIQRIVEAVEFYQNQAISLASFKNCTEDGLLTAANGAG